MSLLSVEDLSVSYGPVEAVRHVSLEVAAGEVVAVLGANGAGKTTTLLAIAGVLRPRRGRITVDGRETTARPAHAVARLGVTLVPEGREIFSRLTVLDNLRLGAWPRRDRTAAGADVDALLERFPVLGRRRDDPAGVLSGGEQQILAIARALAARPRLLLLDEPSLGLAPRMVDEVFAVLATLREEGRTMLLVEQNALLALRCADRAHVMEAGRIRSSGPAAELLSDPGLRRAYLGT